MLVYRSNKYHGQSGSTIDIYRLTGLEAGHPRSRCWEAGLIPGAFPWLAASLQLPMYHTCHPSPYHTHTHTQSRPFAGCRGTGQAAFALHLGVNPIGQDLPSGSLTMQSVSGCAGSLCGRMGSAFSLVRFKTLHGTKLHCKCALFSWGSLAVCILSGNPGLNHFLGRVLWARDSDL